jgi:putative transcriptional regulator
VGDALLRSRLRERRAALDLSQAALAERVGVSRQAIVAIEAERQVPRTELALLLARELRCSVEDLFELEVAESLILPARRGPSLSGAGSARVLLGRVDESWVAHPLVDRHAGGDAIASRRAGDDDMHVEALFPLRELSDAVLVAGCAPLLGVLGESCARRTDAGRTTWIAAHSTRALELLEAGAVHVAGVHLVSSDDPEAHARVVKERFGARSMTVVHLTRFRQGLLVSSGNPKSITSVADFFRSDVRPALRQIGSGAQALWARRVRERGGCPETPPQGPIAQPVVRRRIAPAPGAGEGDGPTGHQS